MESLEAVELAMALEECCGAGGFEIDPETTLGDLHWRMIQQECQRRPPRRSADAAAQIKQQTRIVDLIYCEMIS
jgi:hypothetical protein